MLSNSSYLVPRPCFLAILLYWQVAATMAMGATTLSESGTGDSAFRQMTKALSTQGLALLEEYRTKYREQKDCYRNLFMEVIVRKSLFPNLVSEDNPEGRETMKLVYRSSGDQLFRTDWDFLDWKTEHPIKYKSDAGAVAVGPVHSFNARKGESENYAIKKVYRDRDEAVRNAYYNGYLREPCSASWPMENLLFAPFDPFNNWQIERVTPSEADGERLVSVLCTGITKVKSVTKNAATQSVPKKYGFEFTFLRDRGWALKKYDVGPIDFPGPSDERQIGELEYAGEYNGIPLFKRAVLWREVGPERKRLHVEEFEVTQIIPGPVAEKEFLPSAFNLAIGQSHIDLWPRVLVFGLGIALLYAYFWLKRRAPVV